MAEEERHGSREFDRCWCADSNSDSRFRHPCRRHDSAFDALENMNLNSRLVGKKKIQNLGLSLNDIVSQWELEWERDARRPLERRGHHRNSASAANTHKTGCRHPLTSALAR